MAIHNFADFELDDDLRQLRLRGREVMLQPRAFDVLAYLVDHRARVVDKDELLEALWPGVVVTDSSLQRAVSLARAALRSGGVDGAIRTYSKRGYRFIPELAAGAEDRSGSDSTGDVTEAKALFDSGSWTEAADAFERADSQRPLAAAELECWGTALQCAGTAPAAVEPFQRAAEVYSARNEWEAAARTVIVLARLHFEMQDWAVAKGCLQRAATMLDGLTVCEQHGHLAWMRSWLASYEGAPSKTLDHARKTVEIGRQLGNTDLEAIGLLFWGMALQASGDAQRGLALQDEAGAVVLTGSVTPLLGGLVYCGLIGGCCNTGDWPRAGQWSESFSAWCRRNGVQRFSGSCLLHRVEVFVARGELDRAEDEIRENGEILKMNGDWAIAAAQRFLGDIHFLRGEFQRAETAFRTAYEHGTDPHPGYALLLHRMGHSQAAVRALRRSAEGVTWASMERKPLYLAIAAAIAAATGDVETADGIIRELEGRPGSWTLGTTRAHVLRARGEMDLCRGEIKQAVCSFREALHVHQAMDAALEAAAVRLRLCTALLMLGDNEGAALELDSGEKVLTRNKARLYLDDCRELRSTLDSVAE